MPSSEKMKLAEEDDTLITNEEKRAMKLNNFFSYAIINLKISKFGSFYPLPEKIGHPT